MGLYRSRPGTFPQSCRRVSKFEWKNGNVRLTIQVRQLGCWKAQGLWLLVLYHVLWSMRYHRSRNPRPALSHASHDRSDRHWKHHTVSGCLCRNSLEESAFGANCRYDPLISLQCAALQLSYLAPSTRVMKLPISPP